MNEEKQIGGGLLPLPPDDRDFSLGGIFGTIDLKQIPDDFEVVAPLKIKDQRATDFCTAYTITSVSEDQEGIELSPEFQFFATKMIAGWDGWGADLRSACKSAVEKYSGSLEQKEADTLLHDRYDRDAVLNTSTWTLLSRASAKQHAKKSYFTVDSYGDMFDSIRGSLWQHRAKKCTVAVGSLWRNEWTYCAGGIIPKAYKKGTFGHAFKIFGQKKINGELYLKAQLSNGTDIGDKGIFYFPREVVNKEFNFGAYMFNDLDPEIAKYYSENKIKIVDNWVKQLAKVLYHLLVEFKKKLK